jgi:hypothetical protein
MYYLKRGLGFRSSKRQRHVRGVPTELAVVLVNDINVTLPCSNVPLPTPPTAIVSATSLVDEGIAFATIPQIATVFPNRSLNTDRKRRLLM